MVALQRLAGNRATGQLIARRRATPLPAHAGLDVAALLANQIPELLPLIDAGEIGKMQARYDAQASNEVRDTRIEAGMREYHKTNDDFGDDWQREQIAAIEKRAGPYKPEGGPITFTIPIEQVLSDDILAEPPKNRRLENAFRKWMHDELMKDPKVVVSIDVVALSGSERNQYENAHPDAPVPQTKNQAALVSGGRSLPHTKGKVHFRDLVGSTFAKEYDEAVASNPAIKQIRDSLHEAQDAISDMSVEHQLRIEANKDHPVVRRVAEFLGGGDEIAAWMELAKEIQEHPERGSWEERQEELSTECPPIEIWQEPQKAVDEARATIGEDFEIGAIAYMRAEASLDKAARRYQRYEERVMKGAAIAVKWLGRAKFAGKLAAAALPGYAPVNAALYSLAQDEATWTGEALFTKEGANVDMGAALKNAGMEGAMAFFAGLTQGAFAERLAFRIEARWGEEIMAKYGVKAMDLASNKFIVTVGAAATSAPYNLAANKLLEKIIYGRAAMPKSVDELADMVLDEVATSITVAGVMQGLHTAFEESPGARPGQEGQRPPGTEEHGTPGEGGGGGGGGGAPGEGALGGARPPRPPLGQESAIKYAALARSSPAAAEALIDHLGGRWEVAIEQIQKGTGELAQVDQFARRELVRDLLAHRAEFLKRIGERYQADPVGEPTASTEPGSDVDLNLKGEDAGLRVAQATEYLNQNHPGWQQRYRMGLLVEAGRARSIADHAAKLPRDLHEKLNQWQTMATEASLVSREARAATDPAQRAAIVQRIGDPTWRKFAQEMADLSPEAASDLRIQYAARGDRTYSRIDPEAPPEARYEQIREAMEDQMMANALDPQAYVSGGAIRSVVFGQKTKNPAETYGALIDQVAMLQEMAHESGGMRKALRRYETYKYVQRIAETVRKAGIEEKSANYLYNQAELYANVDRGATSTADPRVISANDLTNKAVTKGTNVRHEDLGPQEPITDEHLEEIYGMVKKIVDTQGPRLRREALGLPSDDQTPLPVALPELEAREPAPPAPVGPGGVPPGSGGPQGPGGGPVGGYQRPPRMIVMDANVLDQINRGNAAAANSLLVLAARGELYISQQSYNEAVVNPLIPRQAAANQLILQELGIPIAPPGALEARVNVYTQNATTGQEGGGVLSQADANVAAQAGALGAEVWSYDGPYVDNTVQVENLGVEVAPESFFAFAVEPADYRVGRFLLGLPEVEITLMGEVQPAPPGGAAAPDE